MREREGESEKGDISGAFFQALVLELEQMMKEAHEKGLEELTEEVREKEEVGEIEGGRKETGKAGEGEGELEKEEEKDKENEMSPFKAPTLTSKLLHRYRLKS